VCSFITTVITSQCSGWLFDNSTSLWGLFSARWKGISKVTTPKLNSNI